MKGDRVEIVVDSGSGVLTDEIEATMAGRRVEVATSRGVIEVSAVTRNGEPVRSWRLMAVRVVALVEHAGPPPSVRSRRVLRGKSQL
jgi:hypothetical protein